MKMILFAASAAVLTVLACAAPSTAADPLVVNDVAWKATPAEGKGDGQFRISHKSSTSNISLDGDRTEFGAVRTALQGGPGPVSFTIVHEAGTLACSGTLTKVHAGSGNCRFTSDQAFEAALRERGLAPERRSDLLAMLMVDATIELADGLTEAGVKPEDNDDLIAAAALKVTPAYVSDLRSEAMVLTKVGDAIALKALDVDGVYVRGLASAGYKGLSAHDVVGMKAMGVSPQYAQAMNAAVAGKAR